MASKEAPSLTSASTSTSLVPTKTSGTDGLTIEQFQKSKDAQKILDWVRTEYLRSKSARSSKQNQWYMNMAMFYGQQWLEFSKSSLAPGLRNKLTTAKRPYYTEKKVVNRTRSFVRSELSKFLSSVPQISVVPGSSEDQDQRAALAAEQVYQSVTVAGKLRYHYSRAAWWSILTGVGFVKTWWDNESTDQFSNKTGSIKYGSVTPFHLFVPDFREQDIEDQPYVTHAYTRTVEWAEMYFKDALKGHDLKASTTAASSILEDGYLNLATANRPDSVIILETWIKPGGSKLFPEGGLVISVEDIIVSIDHKFPNEHGMYPYTKFEHIPTATFYADSPLVDTNELQREYNKLRGEIQEAGRRMAKPQLLAPIGSIVPSRMTNEPGLVIEFVPGLGAPQPMPMSPLPQYYVEQQDRILLDWEDITGEKEVTRGSAPTGVTAGTAINYLQEAANSYLTTQFQSIEEGYEKIGVQTIGLFIQYVDQQRKIKTIGADGAFDTLLLSGSDIKSGTDLRVEKDSSIPKSKAASEAKIMDMFSLGLLPADQALKLLDVGGVQKVMDTLNIAEKKAQRENTKMKKLTDADIKKHQSEWDAKVLQAVNQNFGQILVGQGIPVPLTDVGQIPPEIAQQIPPAPPIIPVDDYDIHAQHVDTHNRFRMGQEYEVLSDALKTQFEEHVSQHQQYLMMAQQQAALSMPPQGAGAAPPDAGGGAPPMDSGAPPAGGGMDPAAMDPAAMGGPQMAANGAVPAPSLMGG